MDAVFKQKVTYVGEEEKDELAFVIDPGDGNVVDVLAVYEPGKGWTEKEKVPRRAPNSPEGNGHTWH